MSCFLRNISIMNFEKKERVERVRPLLKFICKIKKIKNKKKFFGLDLFKTYPLTLSTLSFSKKSSKQFKNVS